MGCSQGKTSKPSIAGASRGKTTKPSVVGGSTTSVEPPRTLLHQMKVQKLKIAADKAVVSSTDRTVGKSGKFAEPLESAAAPQVDEPLSGPLRWRAVRVFAMADKGIDGLLDAKKLAGDCDGSDMFFVEMGNNAAGFLSMTEWLKSVKNLALRDEVKAGVFLDLCQRHIDQQKQHWPLRDEALQVFRMGDRNGDGQLDMNELTEIRQSADFARAMMDNIDIDKDGSVSKGEWLAYIKRLADQNEESAAGVLALYREHLSNSSNTVEAYVAAKSALDALVEDSSVTSTRAWWACY